MPRNVLALAALRLALDNVSDFAVSHQQVSPVRQILGGVRDEGENVLGPRARAPRRGRGPRLAVLPGPTERAAARVCRGQRADRIGPGGRDDQGAGPGGEDPRPRGRHGPCRSGRGQDGYRHTRRPSWREPRRLSPSRRPRPSRSTPTSSRLTPRSSWPRSSSNASAASSPARPRRARITTSRRPWPRLAARARRRKGPAQHGQEECRSGQGRGGEDPVADQRHDPQLHRRGSSPLPAGRAGRGAGQRRQGPHPRQPRRCVHGDLSAGSGRREDKARRRRTDRAGHHPRVRRAGEGDVCGPGGPVHAQASRDPERARQADVPREARASPRARPGRTSSESRPASAASATCGSTTRPPGPNGSTAPSRGSAPPRPRRPENRWVPASPTGQASPAAAGKPVAHASPMARRPPPPNRKRRPPDLDEGDAMASPSVGMSTTPPDRGTAPVASVLGVSHALRDHPRTRLPRDRYPSRLHGRPDRPRRRGQVDAHGPDRRLEEDSGRRRSTSSAAT